MTHIPSISLANLDVDQIKASFIEYLKTQTIFKDYDFTGSNINVLLDILARNTHMNAFMLNMIANESFLDTAQQRDSVVSKAKELNYIPRSWQSAEALLNIDINTPDTMPTIVTIPEGTAFSTRIDDQIFTFTTAEAISSIPTNFIAATNTYVYSFENVSIFEGELVTESFAVDNSEENQRFILSNKQIDTRSIKVSVKESNNAISATTYQYADNLKGLTSESEVFFIQPTESEQYEVSFGDGVLGVKPTTGNIVVINYRVTNGPDANGAELFELISTDIGGYTDFTIETAEVAFAGSEQESIESIKFNAPRHYQTQENAITSNDYEIILRQEFPEIRAIHIYGGDEIDPPQYGKVLISVDLENFDGVPSAKKTAMENFIKPKMPMMFTPEVIDPEFLYIDVNLDVEYKLSLTTKSVEDIKTSIIFEITEYNNIHLEDFDVKFRYSILGAEIDEAETSISSTNLIIRIYKVLIPTLNEEFKGTFDYQNPLEPGSITSTAFTYNDITAFFSDDSNGNLNVSTLNGTNIVSLSTPIGTVDYETGVIKISGITVSDFVGDSIRLYVSAVKQDVTSTKNTILAIGLDNMTINVTPVN